MKKTLNGCATRKEITIQLTDDPQGPTLTCNCIFLIMYQEKFRFF